MRLDPFIETTREEQHEKQHGLDTITKTGLVVATTDTAATFISCAPLVRLNVNQGRQSGTAPCSLLLLLRVEQVRNVHHISTNLTPAVQREENPSSNIASSIW